MAELWYNKVLEISYQLTLHPLNFDHWTGLNISKEMPERWIWNRPQKKKNATQNFTYVLTGNKNPIGPKLDNQANFKQPRVRKST